MDNRSTPQDWKKWDCPVLEEGLQSYDFWKFYARIIYLSSLLLSSGSVVVVSTYRTDESKMEIVKSV